MVSVIFILGGLEVKRGFLFLLLSVFCSAYSMDATDPGAWITISEAITDTIFGSNEQSTQESAFWDWKEQCDQLPKYNNKKKRLITPLSKDFFLKTTVSFLDFSKSSDLSKKENWLHKQRPSDDFFNPDKDIFIPYVQKLVIPSDSIVSFHGDLHGDIHSLNEYIALLIKGGYLNDQLKIIKDNFYMVFLGDYTDRGWYGAEVIYTILGLKYNNPEKVILVRGNHEDDYMNKYYGFEDDLRNKFYNECKNELEFQGLVKAIYRIYNYMPVALYLGCPNAQGNTNFLQCCHGGMEVGFNPKILLASNSAFQLL